MNGAPVLTLSAHGFAPYRERREQFFAQCGVAEFVEECRAEQLRRAEGVVAEVVASPEAMSALRPALRGLRVGLRRLRQAVRDGTGTTQRRPASAHGAQGASP